MHDEVTEEDIANGCWRSQEWRLNHLYWIEQKSGPPCRFKMNWAQKKLFSELHAKNNILKARQLGMSTLTSLMILDGCLFNENWHAAIVDKTLVDAQEKLGKIDFAAACMENPPDGEDSIVNRFARLTHSLMKPKIDATKASFANGSTIRVATSFRGGRYQFLHVSEFGHVAATAPKKAREIITGSLPTADTGIIVMESTHEGGKAGENYRMTKKAMENVGKKLTDADYKFFFFPWWGQAEYSIENDEPLVLPRELVKYFEGLEKQGVTLTTPQKRWYAAQFGVFGYAIRQEYPSTPAEAFETQVEGAIYGAIITDLRSEGRIAAAFEADDNHPLYVSWDIGLSDNMSMWLVQPCGDGKFYILDHYSANNHELAHYIGVVRRWEAIHGQPIATHLLPHDAEKRDLASRTSFRDLFARQGLPARVVPRTPDVWVGIDLTRRLLRHCVFHARCGEPVRVDGQEYMSGINALENYQTLPAGANGVLKEAPLHNACSHSADAFRTFAEGYQAGLVSKTTASFYRPTKNIRSGMAGGVPWAV